jgi:hypothetical protein
LISSVVAFSPAPPRSDPNLSKILLRVSAAIYAIGFFSAYLLGPILSKLDN